MEIPELKNNELHRWVFTIEKHLNCTTEKNKNEKYKKEHEEQMEDSKKLYHICQLNT